MSGLGDEKRQADLQKGWRQIARWLISDVPAQFELRSECRQNPADQESRMLRLAPSKKRTLSYSVSD